MLILSPMANAELDCPRDVELTVTDDMDEHSNADGGGAWISSYLRFIEDRVSAAIGKPFCFSDRSILDADVFSEIESVSLRSLWIQFTNRHYSTWVTNAVHVPSYDHIAGCELGGNYCSDCDEDVWDIEYETQSEAEIEAGDEAEELERTCTCEDLCDSFREHVSDLVSDGVTCDNRALHQLARAGGALGVDRYPKLAPPRPVHGLLASRCGFGLQVGQVVRIKREGGPALPGGSSRHRGSLARITRRSIGSGGKLHGYKLSVDNGDKTWSIHSLESTFVTPEEFKAEQEWPQVGARVILGRHGARGDEHNWTHAMNEYVGLEMQVVSVSDLMASRPYIKVADARNSYNWEIEYLGRPEERDRTGEHAHTLTVGCAVVLGRHSEVRLHSERLARRNFNGEMGEYVGRATVITRLRGFDSSGCAMARVDIDDGRWEWRIRNMRPLTSGSQEFMDADAERSAADLIERLGATTVPGGGLARDLQEDTTNATAGVSPEFLREMLNQPLRPDRE